MKLNYAIVGFFALGTQAAPFSVEGATAVVKRNAAPISAAAVTLIKGLEGFRKNFYTINGDQTIGYGHDCTQQGDCASIHPPITIAQGTTLLKADLKTFETCVCALPNAAGLNSNQYGALVSFAYNSGCGGVSNYFSSYVSSGNYAGICTALPTTNTLNGQLTARRQKEGAFCSQATSTSSGCSGSSSPQPSQSAAAVPQKRN